MYAIIKCNLATFRITTIELSKEFVIVYVPVLMTCHIDRWQSTESAAAELTSCDVKAMLAVNASPVTLLLEGSHVGRGNTW